MSVYVDKPAHPYGRMVMCHMLADTPVELHAMADRIGVARKWYQFGGKPHYDICKSKRSLAVEAGAIELPDRYAVHEVLKRLRASIIADPKPWRPFSASNGVAANE